MIRRIVRLQREEARARQTPLPEAAGIPPQSQWVQWLFSREETLALVRRCRAQQVSAASLAVAVVFCALADCLPGPRHLFKCTFPFDVREFLDGPGGSATAQDVGSFATVMNEYYEVQQPPSLWDLARLAHSHHETFIRHGGPSFYYNLVARADLYDKSAFARRLLARRSANTQGRTSQRVTLLATNYGVTRIRDRYGSLQTRECAPILKHDIGGPLLVLEALVVGGRLNIGFAADSLDPAFWQQLQASVHGYLGAAISGA